MESANQPGSTKPKVVIIGGGFGGLSAAKALAGKPVDVTLIDRTNHHLFQPLLYQVATAGLSPSDIAQPIRHILARGARLIYGAFRPHGLPPAVASNNAGVSHDAER